MPTFQFAAADAQGAAKHGTVRASSAERAAHKLQQHGLRVLEIRPAAPTGTDSDAVPTLAAAAAGPADAWLPVPARARFPGLAAAAFQHPLDKQATGSLRMLKGFDWLVAKFIEYGAERFEYAINIGSRVRVGPRQLPRFYEMLRDCCAVLDVPEPELYVGQGGVNAFTAGNTNPYIVLETGLLDVLDETEILAVIAHELGHIKCGHVLYYTMARLAGPFFEMAGDVTLGLGSLIGQGVVAGLLAWQRRSELSADRAALLAVQDVGPCIGMLLKLAGGSLRWGAQLDREQFLNQARAYQEGIDQSTVNRLYRLMAMSTATHPASVERARALDEWVGSGEYQEILAGRYPRPTAALGPLCPTCNERGAAGVKFCPKCATPLRVT